MGKKYGSEPSEHTFSSRFAGLIRRACEQTGKQVVILVDEYDKPLLETMHDDPALNETYRKILKGFYGVIKSSDQYLRFAFLTGVTKFSKVSIFSDLNNLRDISLEENYAGICGVSETELKECFQPEIQALGERQKLNYDETLARLKQWYDGYLFHPDEVRYGFLDNLVPAYTGIRVDKTGLSIWQFYEQLEAGDVDGFMEKLKGMISGIPYDSVTEKDVTLREQNYQAAVYLVFALMSQFVQTEVQSAKDGGGSK